MAKYAFSVFDDYIPGFKLVPSFVDSLCDEKVTLQAALHNFSNPNVALIGIIGDLCPSPAIAVSQLGASPDFKMFQISPTALLPPLPTQYFLKTTLDSFTVGHSAIATAEKFKWHRVGIMASSDTGHMIIANHIAELIRHHPLIRLAGFNTFPTDVGYNMVDEVKAFRDDVVTVIFFAGFPNDFRSFIRVAASFGMTKKPYVIISIAGSFSDLVCAPNYPKFPGYEENHQANLDYHTWFTGVLGLQITGSPSSQVIKDFMASPFYVPRPRQLGDYISHIYDAVESMARTANYMMIERNWTGPIGPEFRAEMANYALNYLDFEGITGRIKYDPITGNVPGMNISLGFFGQNNCKITIAMCYNQESDQWTEETPIIWSDGTLEPPPDSYSYVHVSNGIGIAFQTIAAIMISLLIICIVAILLLWRHPRIQAATPPFLVLICLGLMLGSSIIFVIAQYPTSTLCIIPHWFGHFAFMFVFNCLFLKTWRIWEIFYSDLSRANQYILTNFQLFLVSLVGYLGLGLVLALFTALDPPYLIYYTTGDPLVINVACYYSLAWVMPLYAAEGLLLLFTLYLIWKTRGIKIMRFNETASIFVCIYSLFIIGLLIMPSVHFMNITDLDTLFVLESLALLIASLTIVCALLGPKFYSIYKAEVDVDQQPHNRLSN